ncbi:MAG: hypothetical protein WAT61_13045 [Flavobacteriales bacterium]|nr:hypothetical protein [Flavobacteriales bacterium]
MRTLQLLLIVPFTATFATAQIPGFQGNLGGTVGISVPTGEFADTWGKNMFTFGGQFAVPMGLLPLQGGFAFDYSVMGRSVSTVPVSDPALTASEGSLAVRAKVLSYHPLLRLSPLKGKVRPYVDGMLGLRQFTTLSTVSVDGLENSLSRERNANDFAFSTGWAAGLMVGLGGIGYIEARVERFNSGNATYVDPNSIAVDAAGNVGFNTLNSNTDAVNVLLGIGLRF